MNREIKFRVWSVRESRMILHDEATCLGVTIASPNKEPYQFPLLPAAFCDGKVNFIAQQYTGLKDKNGKEIYEGDVITTTIYGDWGDVEQYEVVQLVEWSYIQVGWRGFTKKMLESVSCSGNIFGVETKVIGNVCQNPELLS